jgi:hypothetical protein
MIVNEQGSINLQSALNQLVDMGVENPNIFNQYKQNPPSWLGKNAGLLINMAANMVGDQRQRAQATTPPQSTVMDQNIAKATQPQGLAGLNPMMADQQRLAMQEVQPSQMPTQEMAEGGLAGLDTGNMYNEQNYATGGIVAFEDGGEVRHYKEGDYVLPADYDPEAMMAEYAEEEANIPYTADDDVFSSKRKRAIKALQEKSKSPYDPAIDFYKSLPKPLISANPIYTRPENVLGREREKWFKSKPPMAPAVDVTADKKEDLTKYYENQVKKDKANESALKKANDDYLGTVKQSNADQISSYDQAMQRVLDLAKNDPVRQQLRDEYAKEKEGAWYDVAGDIGAALLGAKRGQEGVALQQGVTAATGRVKDLRKQKRDLMLAEQKADHDYQLLGAKYGFDSEQARAALSAKERIAEANNRTEITKYNILSGAKDRAQTLNAVKGYNKAFNDWSKGTEGTSISMMASMKLTGDKARDDQIKAAQKRLADVKREFMVQFGVPDINMSANVGSAADNSLISKYLTKTKPEED